MARWTPPNNVGLNERIGRRLFDEPMLKGAAGQPSFAGIPLSHFEETRCDKVSLDRLGASGIDRKVTRYLLPRAEAAGRTFAKPKTFDGWAFVLAKELVNASKVPKLAVVASPVTGPEPDENIYHAHVVRPKNVDRTMMALYLRHTFTEHGSIEKNKTKGPNWRDRLSRKPLIRWIVAQLPR